jgi:RNA polymerase sigma-70 factor (ECF subfamily)
MTERKLQQVPYREQVSEEPSGWTAFDRAMTEVVFRQHAPFVAGFLGRLGVPARHIDDEVVRVFAEVHRRSACVPNDASSKAWMGAVALRCALRRFHLSRVDLAVGANVPEPTIPEFLQTLDPELRATFILFELDGEPSESIAAAFGMTLEGVHERLHAGQRAFRRAYGLLDVRETEAVEGDERGLAFVDPVSIA